MLRIPARRIFKHKKDHDKKYKKKEKMKEMFAPEKDKRVSQAQDLTLDNEISIEEKAQCTNDADDKSFTPSGNENTVCIKLPFSDAGDNDMQLLGDRSGTIKISYSGSDYSSSVSSSVDMRIFDIVTKPNLMKDVAIKLEKLLPRHCICVVLEDQLYVLFLSRSEDKITQRQLTFLWNGQFSLKVHCKPYPVESMNKNVLPSKYLCLNSLGYFVDRIIQIVNVVTEFEICAGVENSDFKDVWNSCDRGVIDRNPYREFRYTETCRSVHCEKLVHPRRRKCVECNKLFSVLQRKHKMAQNEEVHLNTPNVHLSSAQKLYKLDDQCKKLKNTKRQLKRLNVESIIEKEGVTVEDSISSDLRKLLQNLDFEKLVEEKRITREHVFFLEQQLLALSQGPRGRRWHPSMIRFALSIFQKSPAAYGAIYESGLLTLPCRRTLFDYTHFRTVQDGIHFEVLEIVSKKVAEMKTYQRYHVLMCDEMYISRNLVYEKSTGRMIGFITLDELQIELSALEYFLKDPDVKKSHPPISSKVLTFFINGVANNVKEAVASYAVDVLTKEQLYRYSWDVITKCERAGIAIIAFVMDGNAINRGFIKMNKPFSANSGTTYDTLNKAAPFNTLNKMENKVRLLYFIADPPHLLKTIRNCFHSSSEKRYLNKRTGKMMLRRRLQKNGQKILWATIVRLYNRQLTQTLRLSYKLNAQNVFLNSYSKMKVKYAAEVMSETVAHHLEEQKWEGTEETIKFIKNVDAFFDMLNGVHTHQGSRKRKPNLEPYCSVNDNRFEGLENFLVYLKEWKDDAIAAAAANTIMNETVTAGNNEEMSDPGNVDKWEDEEVDQDPASIHQLSKQTLEGIEITINGFKGAVQFLLKEGVQFINARVFNQDPLEQYYSKQRSRGGGSTNPNFRQTLHNQRSIHVQGNLGVRKNYRGNTEVESQCMILSDEPLPKRSRIKVQYL